MITRVVINGYKSLKDVDLELGILTLLIGPNASGKSNLLDALGLLSRMVTGSTVKSAFDEHRGNPIEAFSVPSGGSLSRDALRFSLAVEVELSDSTVEAVERLVRDMREGLPTSARSKRVIERRMRYDLTIEFLTSTGMLRVLDERLVALRKDGAGRKDRKPFLERMGDRLRLRMEGQAHPIYHDVGLDHTILSTPLYPPHYPHITAFKEELRRWRFYYFDPSIMRLESPLKDVTTLGHNGSDLTSYYHSLKMRNAKQFENLERALQMVVPAADGIHTTVTDGGLVQLNLDEDDTNYSSRVISDGTLRVLGLLAILAPGDSSTTVGFEEPENGVHPRRLRIVARLLNAAHQHGKQLIVTTHSPKLPDYIKHTNYDTERQIQILASQRNGGQSKFTPIDYKPLFGEQDANLALEEALERGDLGG